MIDGKEKHLEIKVTPTFINGEVSLIVLVNDTTH